MSGRRHGDAVQTAAGCASEENELQDCHVVECSREKTTPRAKKDLTKEERGEDRCGFFDGDSMKRLEKIIEESRSSDVHYGDSRGNQKKETASPDNAAADITGLAPNFAATIAR